MDESWLRFVFRYVDRKHWADGLLLIYNLSHYVVTTSLRSHGDFAIGDRLVHWDRQTETRSPRPGNGHSVAAVHPPFHRRVHTAVA